MLDTWSCHWQAWAIKIIVGSLQEGIYSRNKLIIAADLDSRGMPAKCKQKWNSEWPYNLCNSQLLLNRANYLPRFQLYPFVRGASKKLPRSCPCNNKVLYIKTALASFYQFLQTLFWVDIQVRTLDRIFTSNSFFILPSLISHLTHFLTFITISFRFSYFSLEISCF